MDVHDKTTRSYNMSKIRSKNTLPEMKVRKKHKVPLSDEAISIIELMRKKHNHEYYRKRNIKLKIISSKNVFVSRRAMGERS